MDCTRSSYTLYPELPYSVIQFRKGRFVCFVQADFTNPQEKGTEGRLPSLPQINNFVQEEEYPFFVQAERRV